MCSALGGTRTPNLLIRNQMLYPIEPRALILLCKDLILPNEDVHAPYQGNLILLFEVFGGEGGIRTLERGVTPLLP